MPERSRDSGARKLKEGGVAFRAEQVVPIRPSSQDDVGHSTESRELMNQPLSKAQMQRFHDLVDKQLAAKISDAELNELNALRSAHEHWEAADEQTRRLRMEWSTKFDQALNVLDGLNRRLDVLTKQIAKNYP
jgi:hypothetical protein